MKTFPFQAIQFSQSVLIHRIQFSINTDFVNSRADRDLKPWFGNRLGENSKFTPALLRLKIGLISHPPTVMGLGRY